MTEEIIIDGELSCNNCLQKTRCKQQQEVKKRRIDAILSYIANEDNEKYIAELKNEIPAITRCDVVLEKQLTRLEQENFELEESLKVFNKPDVKKVLTLYNCGEIKRLEQENKELKELIGKTRYNRLEMYESFKTECNNYRSALEDINIIVKNYCNACDEFKVKTYKNKNDCLYCNYGFIKNKINEVLNA